MPPKDKPPTGHPRKPDGRSTNNPKAGREGRKRQREAKTDALLAKSTADLKGRPAFIDGARLSEPEDAPQPYEFLEITDLKKRLYLQCLCRDQRFTVAARAAGISTATGYHWRQDKSDTAFQAAFERAWKMGIESAEAELWRRGIKGYKTPVYYKGQLAGTEMTYDTTAAIFMLKGAMPEKYRERYEHSGPQGGPIQSQAQVVFAQLPTEELVARLQNAAEVLKAANVAVPQLTTAQPTIDVANDPLAAYEAELARRNGGNGNGSNGGGQ